VKNFLENYAEIYGLSPGRNVRRITQSLTFLPAETSYKSVYRDFIAGLENDSTLKYDAFRKLWHQLMPYILQERIYVTRANIFGTADNTTKDLLKKFKEHLAKAKLERNYYEISRTTEKISR